MTADHVLFVCAALIVIAISSVALRRAAPLLCAGGAAWGLWQLDAGIAVSALVAIAVLAGVASILDRLAHEESTRPWILCIEATAAGLLAGWIAFSFLASQLDGWRLAAAIGASSFIGLAFVMRFRSPRLVVFLD